MTKEEMKCVRKTHNLTQHQLAEQTGYSARSIQAMEQGWRKIPKRMDKLVQVLKPAEAEKPTV